MSDQSRLNERGNHQGEFTQGVGGWAEYTVYLTQTSDGVRHDVKLPPRKIIPVIFLPGVMGSNLRLSKERQDKLKRPDNRSWRPDDMVGINGAAALANAGLVGWYKNASPAQRQLMLDPNETEVEYYHYTESNDRFDPEGPETFAADNRHQNVPEGLEFIPPLLGTRITGSLVLNRRLSMKKRASPAQIARWRGWSEVLFAGAYGQVLRAAERHLNNMTVGDAANPIWKPFFADPRTFGGVDAGAALTEQDLKKIVACWYPVHAMGYNYLKSNGETAKVIADRIRGLTKGYQKRGFKCDEVIIVTHSMGGLLARALIHPKYGNLLNDPAVKVLGIYHNVMPTMGAAASYKRMRFGFLEQGMGYIAETGATVLGIDGKHATAILANAPAALELFPGSAYGKGWLKVVDGAGREMWTWPGDKASALDSIYLQPADVWWRLINPKWVNPGNVKKENGGGIENVFLRLTDASKFIEDIKQSFHPASCYASFCSSQERLSYGEVVFKVMDPDVWDSRNVMLSPVETWKLLSDDAQGTLKVQTASRVLTLALQRPTAPGDETVPAARSAKQIMGKLFVHGETKGNSYEHQNSYADKDVLASLLYSVVQIAKTAKWEAS